MGTYDSIAVPVDGQKISVDTYGIPVRDAIRDLDIRMSLREAAELLPESVSAANMTNTTGTFSGTAATFSALTVNPISCIMTNPSTIFDLVCNVYFGAWMNVASAAQVRLGVLLTGGVSAGPNSGFGVPNQPVGAGLSPQSSSANLDQHVGFFQCIIPAGAAAVTFAIHGYRSSAVATVIQYPTIYVVPDRYQLP